MFEGRRKTDGCEGCTVGLGQGNSCNLTSVNHQSWDLLTVVWGHHHTASCNGHYPHRPFSFNLVTSNNQWLPSWSHNKIAIISSYKNKSKSLMKLSQEHKAKTSYYIKKIAWYASMKTLCCWNLVWVLPAMNHIGYWNVHFANCEECWANFTWNHIKATSGHATAQCQW